MAKIDLSKVVADVQRLHNKNPTKVSSIGLGTNLKSMADGNFLVMPDWWQKGTNTKGLPFGGYVMIAGDSDSGKTSAAITAMKAAQEQGIAVIYIETENKTTTKDLENWGVDPSQVMLAKATVAEDAWNTMFQLWDSFEKNYPQGKLLIIFDSIGNTVSKHDIELDMTESNSKPGGKGKTNRSGINSLVARMIKGNATGLMLNYTYDNMGSPGKTNAGGKALNFFSSLTYQVSRKGWIEATIKGVKVRKGAKVQWKLFKNHIDKANPGPKVIELDITAEGVSLAGTGDD